MITREEILMGRDKNDPLTPDMEKNLTKLLEAINKVRKQYGKSMVVTSGYRPESINKGIAGAAKKSAHTTCEAIDIKDTDGSLFKWVVANINFIAECGLYVEDKRWTKTWVHFQVRPTKQRIFKAYTSAPPHPELWDGKIS